MISFPTTHAALTGNSYYNPAPATYPKNEDSGEINRYSAGSFTFTAVPEPASSSLLAVGVLGMPARRQRPV